MQELTLHAVEALEPFGARAALLRDFASLLRDRTALTTAAAARRAPC